MQVEKRQQKQLDALKAQNNELKAQLNKQQEVIDKLMKADAIDGTLVKMKDQFTEIMKASVDALRQDLAKSQQEALDQFRDDKE